MEARFCNMSQNVTMFNRNQLLASVQLQCLYFHTQPILLTRDASTKPKEKEKKEPLFLGDKKNLAAEIPQRCSRISSSGASTRKKKSVFLKKRSFRDVPSRAKRSRRGAYLALPERLRQLHEPGRPPPPHPPRFAKVKT